MIEEDPNPELTDRVEALLLKVLVEANYDVDAALRFMGGKNPAQGLRNRTLRVLFEAMKDAMEVKQ